MNHQSSENNPETLVLAKQEDTEIITAKLNQSLGHLGIRTTVALKNAYLGILLEATDISEREQIVTIVRQQLSSLKSESIQAIRIYGREVGQLTPQWCEEIECEKSIPSNNSLLSLTDWLSQGMEVATSELQKSATFIDRDIQKFLRFHFNSDSTALLPLSTIKEVLNIPVSAVHPVPHMAECLLGIYDYRGEILWVVDLGQQLGLTPSINSLNTDFLTVIVIQDKEKCLGMVVPKVVDIEMHDIQEMQPASGELFSAKILPFLQGYLIYSSSPVLNPSVLIGDSQLQLC